MEKLNHSKIGEVPLKEAIARCIVCQKLFIETENRVYDTYDVGVAAYAWGPMHWYCNLWARFKGFFYEIYYAYKGWRSKHGEKKVQSQESN